MKYLFASSAVLLESTYSYWVGSGHRQKITYSPHQVASEKVSYDTYAKATVLVSMIREQNYVEEINLRSSEPLHWSGEGQVRHNDQFDHKKRISEYLRNISWENQLI